MSAYKNEEIKSIDKINVKGHIIDNGTEDYEVVLHISGELTLKSAINGSDVPYKLDIDYDEFITNLVSIYKNGSNSLDILPIIWENILLEIPIRAVNADDEFNKTAGEGWEILESE
jgi:uncharacterized metal-binding protein YceD (DUF177 family)